MIKCNNTNCELVKNCKQICIKQLSVKQAKTAQVFFTGQPYQDKDGNWYCSDFD